MFRRNYKDAEIVNNSKYFDENYYLSTYPDIKNYKRSPACHYLLHGWKEGRNPSKDFITNSYIRVYQKGKAEECPIVHAVKNNITPEFSPSELQQNLPRKEDMVTPTELYNRTLCAPFEKLNVRLIDAPIKRCNIIFHGFVKSQMFGGKATELALAMLFCNKYDYELRIISQSIECECIDYVCSIYNIEKPKKISFVDLKKQNRFPLSNSECFICTMWLTAKCVLDIQLFKGKIFYMMQEVETFFYDHGDMGLLTELTLKNERLIPIVNSKLLYDYFSNEGYQNVIKNGMWFNPVFNANLYKPSKNAFEKKDKYKLFFYGRPHHQRNIFYFALKCLDKAFALGKLDPKKWEIYVAGDDVLNNIQLESDVPFHQLGIMEWTKYCEMLGNIDLCFSLMYTPHPSYPPLDAATAGSVVVTNKYLNKQNLDNYSKNILMAELDENDIINTLAKGQELAFDCERRKKNYEQSHTAGTWEECFDPILEKMKEMIE